jgi:hypothetical protein
MWKMSVQWSLAENDASFRGGSGADDDLLFDLSGDKDKKDKAAQAGGKAAPAKGSKGR